MPRPASADLEWKLIYVGSAESEEYDQVLDSVLVGPVYPGQYRFVFQVPPPLPVRHSLPSLGYRCYHVHLSQGPS